MSGGNGQENELVPVGPDGRRKTSRLLLSCCCLWQKKEMKCFELKSTDLSAKSISKVIEKSIH
jgi:hypothetical protein